MRLLILGLLVLGFACKPKEEAAQLAAADAPAARLLGSFPQTFVECVPFAAGTAKGYRESVTFVDAKTVVTHEILQADEGCNEPMSQALLDAYFNEHADAETKADPQGKERFQEALRNGFGRRGTYAMNEDGVSGTIDLNPYEGDEAAGVVYQSFRLTEGRLEIAEACTKDELEFDLCAKVSGDTVANRAENWDRSRTLERK